MDDEEWVPNFVDAVCAPNDVAAWAANVEPGPLMVQVLSLVDPVTLTYAGQVDAAVAWEKLKAWADARQQAVLASLSLGPAPRPVVSSASKNWVREEVACALTVSFGAAATRLADAVELTTRLPGTLRLLERGVISPRHATVLAEAVARFDDRVAAEIEARALARAGEQPLHLFRRSLTRAVHAVDPATVEARRVRAEADRCVRFRAAEDGMSSVWGLLPAEDAATLDTLLGAMAQQMILSDPGDPRTVDQRRADALTAVAAERLTGVVGAGRLPSQHGAAPRVQVTVALSTLLGLDEQSGELTGYGPIPAQVARRIAADESGTWYRLVTDAQGHVIDAGTTKYRPPPDLAAYVIARDGTCRFPQCGTPAHRSELDHVTDYAVHPYTTARGLEALHSRHHHTKHDGGWRVVGDANGDLTWTSPAGRTYITRPAEHPIDHTTSAEARDRTEDVAATVDHTAWRDPPESSNANADPPPF